MLNFRLDRAANVLNSWWTTVQVCVWIETRDEREVSLVSANASLTDIVEIISRRFWGPSFSEVASTTAVDNVCKALVTACADGTVGLMGRRKGDGEHTLIPASDWAALEIVDQGKGEVVGD